MKVKQTVGDSSEVNEWGDWEVSIEGLQGGYRRIYTRTRAIDAIGSFRSTIVPLLAFRDDKDYIRLVVKRASR